MKITIDRTKCDGYAKCVQAAPKVFKLDAKDDCRSDRPQSRHRREDPANSEALPDQSNHSRRRRNG